METVFSRRVAAVLFLLVTVFHSGEQFPRSVENDIEKFVEDIMKCKSIPGLTLAVVHDRKSMLRGFGVTDFRSNSTVDEKTLFCIGSVSKSFTATVLGKALYDSKRWNWDTPVSEIIGGGFRLSDDYRTKYITVRDILSHRTGVPGYEGGFVTGLKIDMETLAGRLRYLNATYPAHSKFIYNNYMYMLAGYVAEKITGKTWEELIQNEIFNNLGMKSSVFVQHLGNGPNVAKAFGITSDGKLVELPKKFNSMVHAIEPAGAICSNAEDMAKYLRFHLNHGELPSGKKLVDRDIFDTIHAPQMPLGPETGLFQNVLKPPMFPASFNAYAYAFGFFAATYRGYHLRMHSGGISSYVSNLWLIPDEKIAIFSSFNGPNGSGALRLIHQYITDRLLGLKPWMNGTTACQFPYKWLEDFWKAKAQAKNKNTGDTEEKVRRDARNTAPARPLKQFVGKYGHLAFGNITIVLKKSDGKLHLHAGRWGHAHLERTSNSDEFQMRFVDGLQYLMPVSSTIMFSSSDGKRIDRLHASYIEETAPPLFERGKKWNQHSQPAKRSITVNKREHTQYEGGICGGSLNCLDHLLGISFTK